LDEGQAEMVALVEPLLKEEGFLAMPDKKRNVFWGVFGQSYVPLQHHLE
jgi:hypothetical protein